MAKYDMEMILEYAKVFPQNYDKGDIEAPKKSAAYGVAAKGGQTVVNAYFTKQEDLDRLIEDGMDLTPMNHNRVIEGNQEFGIGKYMKLKRLASDNIKEFTNKKTKEVTQVNYGGFPKIVDLRDPENKRLWDYEEDGPLGNGTKAIVRFDMYSDGAGLRLEAIAVKEHVPYSTQGTQEKSEYADVWDV